MDYVPLTNQKQIKNTLSNKKSNDNSDSNEPKECDDFAGVLINASKSINIREMIIIWLWFLIIHSEMFIERFISHLPEACTDQNELTMNGTIYASFIMIIGVVIIDMVYR